MSLTNNSGLPKSHQGLIAYCLLLGIIGTTLLSLTSYTGLNRIAEMLSHFKVQYLVISLLLFALLLLTRRKKIINSALFCLVIILIEIAPWYIPHASAESESTSQVRVFLSNVHEDSQSYSKVISLVREENPDVAVFDEVDDAWIEHLNTLKDILPHSLLGDDPSKVGIAVYSNLPLDKVAIDYLGTKRNPGILANFSIDKQVVSLVAVHPMPPFKTSYFQSRNKQLEEISEYVRQLKTPVLILGDLNMTMWSPYYKKLVSQTGLRNARQGFGILPSWPAKSSVSQMPNIIAPLVSIPIDHCLISSEIKVSQIRTGRNVGSDHLPLIADLVIPGKQ